MIFRYAKVLTGLDLKNCRKWNPFLEVILNIVFSSYMFFFLFLSNYFWHLQIHYDRIGKDGIFSHKEITVLYIPDLSDCLPSIDSWRDQWLAHKKAVAERERLQALKREVWRKQYVFYKQNVNTKQDESLNLSGTLFSLSYIVSFFFFSFCRSRVKRKKLQKVIYYFWMRYGLEGRYFCLRLFV